MKFFIVWSGVVIAIIFLFVSAVQAQTETFDLQFVVVTNDGTNLDILVQIKSSSTFGLATSNLVFTFSNVSNFYTPSPSDLVVYNYSGGGNYDDMTMTNPAQYPERISLNITYTGGGATPVPTSWTDVATVRLPVANPSGSTTLEWRTVAPQATYIYMDLGNNSTALLNGGTLSNLVVGQLPVELTSFLATYTGKTVATAWSTATEVNCYGFEIERSSDAKSWSGIGFVQGHGTSNSSNVYYFSDPDPGASPALFYRLKMLDRDGTSRYSQIASVQTGRLASSLSLEAVYPNPLSSSAMVRFSIPSDETVQLELYDMMGRKVQELFHEALSKGNYSRSMDVSKQSAGRYVLRLFAGRQSTSASIMLRK